MTKKTHNVYVINLDPEVLRTKKFFDANPKHIEGKACYYVGMTGKSPNERYAQHKSGYKANSFARKFGRWLSRKKFEKLNPMTHDEAVEMEVMLAEKLRSNGHAVWQK